MMQLPEDGDQGAEADLNAQANVPRGAVVVTDEMVRYGTRRQTAQQAPKLQPRDLHSCVLCAFFLHITQGDHLILP